MLKISFQINGRTVSASDIKDVFERAILSAIEENLRKKLSGVRDPETGDFPVVAVRGRSLENLSFQITGSDKLIALVKERLGTETDDFEAEKSNGNKMGPCAFLCHASEDKGIARKIAQHFQASGIDTFFDEWEIGPGDSLRRKIDGGLGRCTDFVVILSPQSMCKPWVNAEIDAGFVRKLDGVCRFIPLRYGLEVKDLPPLLRAMHSPVLSNYEHDIKYLVDFIHGVSRKPPLGAVPQIVQASSGGKLGLSPVAEAIVRFFIEHSEHGDAMDPDVEPEQLRQITGLSDDDLVDAIDELESGGFVVKHHAIGYGHLGFMLTPEGALFVAFDKYFKDWDPEADALRIAADLVNGHGDGIVPNIAKEFSWSPRRMNPAINYLVERHLVEFSREIGTHPWSHIWISKIPATRRFVRSRV